MKDKILTIDVGTGSTRAAIVRIDGAMIGFAQREYEQTTPRAGWSEQAPSLWWQAACDCIREVLYRYPETAAQIAVIGACGQMHGTVLLDDRGELVEDRALLWNDKRSQPQVDAFNAREGWEKWLAHLNNPPAAAWPAFKLAWWRENHPDRWSQLAKVLMPKDYINFMLTGAMATDYSEASCYFLMDSETRSWSSQACETFGLRVDQLPELKLSSDIIGQVTQRAADLTGLPAGIPVVAGTSDMAASLLGSGVYEPGMASDSTGTSTLMTVVSPRPLHHPLVNNLHLANAARVGFTILDAGGDAVRWARLALADNQITHPQLLQEAAAVPAGAEGLLFLPYLTGERLAEHTNSRAQFFGLQRKHRRGHLFRAVLEGVAFASWRNLRQLQKCGQYPQQMIASGGGARSSLWLEIKASAYNLPILSTRNQENGVTGCGIIAGVGVGLYADFASGVRQTVQFDKLISPDPLLRDYYHACCELFDTLYRQSAALYDRLDALSVGPD
ncbi:TPA: FGGY-family carbohydrate kinase [Klebsiella pneumoniae]